MTQNHLSAIKKYTHVISKTVNTARISHLKMKFIWMHWEIVGGSHVALFKFRGKPTIEVVTKKRNKVLFWETGS